MKRALRKYDLRLCFGWVVMMLLSCQLAFAQQNLTVKGKVLDENKEALQGAAVLIKGTTIGTVVGPDGSYTLNNVPSKAVLVFSFVGMKTEEVAVNGRSSIHVTLKDDTQSLSDLVVVGYTTQRKESLTGAMINLKSDKLKDITSPSVENLLNGKAPGVYVAPGSGQPGAGGAVVIRGQATLSGTTQPLWVIDGVIVGSNAGQLNPADVETMTILKDAASDRKSVV